MCNKIMSNIGEAVLKLYDVQDIYNLKYSHTTF